MIDVIVSYKKSVAFFAAYKIGLFDYIKKHGCFGTEICDHYGWDKDVFRLFCLFLIDEGILIEQNNKYYPSKETERQIVATRNICEHEINLYDRWITPEHIIDAIREGYGNRKFDKLGFSPKEKMAYDRTMYNSNLDLIAFDLLRRLKKSRLFGMDVLEYGKSCGKLSKTLKKYIDTLNITSLNLDDELPLKKKYDLILIYNSIHYRLEWSELYTLFLNSLRKNGVLCIVDIFYDNNSEFSTCILMDWITHGGIHNLYSDEVCKILNQVGFKNIQKRTINKITTQIVYAYK